MPWAHWASPGQRLCILNMNEAVTFNWENTTRQTQELETSQYKQHRATKSLPPYPRDICDLLKVTIVCLIMLASSQRQMGLFEMRPQSTVGTHWCREKTEKTGNTFQKINVGVRASLSAGPVFQVSVLSLSRGLHQELSLLFNKQNSHPGCFFASW